MSPAAFINPAVIQRTSFLSAIERGEAAVPFRYREGMAVPGSAATLPLRYLAAGALGGVQASFAALTRTSPGVRGRAAGWLRRAASRPPASGRRAIGSRSGPGSSTSTPAPPVGTTSASASTPTATPATCRRRGCSARPACCFGERIHSRAGRLPDPGGRARHRLHRSFQAGGAALLGRVMNEGLDTGTTVGRPG